MIYLIMYLYHLPYISVHSYS